MPDGSGLFSQVRVYSCLFCLLWTSLAGAPALNHSRGRHEYRPLKSRDNALARWYSLADLDDLDLLLKNGGS